MCVDAHLDAFVLQKDQVLAHGVKKFNTMMSLDFVCVCVYVCVCLESLPVKEGGRERVHCTMSQ